MLILISNNTQGLGLKLFSLLCITTGVTGLVIFCFRILPTSVWKPLKKDCASCVFIFMCLRGPGVRSLSVAELNERLEETETNIRRFSEELVQQLALRDELDFEKEVKNSFISALIDVQNRQKEHRELLKKKKKLKVGTGALQAEAGKTLGSVSYFIHSERSGTLEISWSLLFLQTRLEIFLCPFLLLHLCFSLILLISSQHSDSAWRCSHLPFRIASGTHLVAAAVRNRLPSDFLASVIIISFL